MVGGEQRHRQKLGHPAHRRLARREDLSSSRDKFLILSRLLSRGDNFNMHIITTFLSEFIFKGTLKTQT